MKAYKSLIKYVLSDGYTISVWDGEEWQVKRSNSYKAIVEAVESVDEASLRIRNTEGVLIGWALVSDAVDLADDETIIDYSDNEYMQLATI
jgi:hypothetical protein